MDATITIKRIITETAEYYGLMTWVVRRNPGRGGVPKDIGAARSVVSYLSRRRFGFPPKAVAAALNADPRAVDQHCRTVEATDRIKDARAIEMIIDPPPAKQPWETESARVYASPHKPPRGPQPPERERMAHLAGYR